MKAKEQDLHQITCPRCGGDAEWSFLDEEKSRISVVCPDCGRHQVAREEFDQVAVENAEMQDEPR
jgi:endogenous inhibitor of DNA gyrase (YacG/DUF329 family)